MKLIFFVIALCLVGIRLYFSWSGRESHNGNKGEVAIQGEHLNERIEWLGQIRLNSGETGLTSISPGGYLKYIKNDTQVIAESNVKGIIQYQFPGGEDLTDSAKAEILCQAIKEWIDYGFDAKNRMERVYRQGGYTALIREFAHLKLDNLQQMYLDRITQSDSLSTADLVLMTEEMRHRAPEEMQGKFLCHIPVSRLDSPAIRLAYFQTVDSWTNDIVKQNVLLQLIQQRSLLNPVIDLIIGSCQQLSGDNEKQSIYNGLIDIIGVQKEQWIDLLRATGALTDDLRKSQLLIHISRKMPRSETLLSQYRSTAKTIASDVEYGKALRAIN